jgi:hypothetical protein
MTGDYYECNGNAAADPAAELEATLLDVFEYEYRDAEAYGDAQSEEAEARAEAAANLAPALLGVFDLLAEGPVALPCHSWTYADGSRWGYPGGLIRTVSWPHKCEFLLSLDPDDHGILRVGRNPHWPDRRFFELRLDDPDLRRQALMLIDGWDPWSRVVPDPEFLAAETGRRQD